MLGAPKKRNKDFIYLYILLSTRAILIDNFDIFGSETPFIKFKFTD